MIRTVFLAALVLSGCSVAGPSSADVEDARSPEAEGVIVNRTSGDFIAVAFDSDLAAVINIANEFEVAGSDAVVRRGEAAPLAVGGYREGEDFIVYLFRVRGSQATYTTALPIDHDDFAREDAVVTARRL